MTSAVPAPSREMSSLVAALEEDEAILTAPNGQIALANTRAARIMGLDRVDAVTREGVATSASSC